MKPRGRKKPDHSQAPRLEAAMGLFLSLEVATALLVEEELEPYLTSVQLPYTGWSESNLYSAKTPTTKQAPET